MIRRDAELLWRPERLFIPALFFTGMTTVAINEGGATAHAQGATWASAHTSTPIAKEISTIGHVGLLMNTDGMEVTHYMTLPYSFDITQPLHVRLHWTNGGTDVADTALFKVRYTKIVPNTTAIIDVATDLDTAIATDTTPVATANTWAATEWGILDPKTTAIADNVEAILWEVEMDTKDSDMSEDLWLLGMELMWTPKRLAGVDGMPHAAKRGTYAFSKELAN